MADVADGYDAYYAERLWQLLPAVYRTSDTDSYTAPGPLRELLDRIGAQVAVVRRSIDRTWADQSIDTCDDWVIPYIGDLLGTNLINGLDARGQRLDVAKTIHYRRRKGAVAVLEEIARDVTGWDVHVVESFRRLARTRHGLDPAVGPRGYPTTGAAQVPELLRTERLIGSLTGTPAGGYADLRSAHGSGLTDGPFDEFFHTFEARRGQGRLGHYGIPKLLVFLWRLSSFSVVGGTPVAVAGCPEQYVFDPTGRQVPLFLPAPATAADFADSWVSAKEWQVSDRLTASLEQALTDAGATAPPHPPYPDQDLPSRYAVTGASIATLWPALGRFAVSGTTLPQSVDYQYGFAANIGAGPYDRDLLGGRPVAVGSDATVAGGSGLDAALAALAAVGTVTVDDSLTYSVVADVGAAAAPIENVLVRAGAERRPVVRLATGSAAWVFTGGGQGVLVLDGLLVSGCDVILRGSFDTVLITACTFDPGAAGDGVPLATAVDGAVLAPVRVWIEADPDAPAASTNTVRNLQIDHCILGPVRTRLGGTVENLTVSDSIVQALPATTGADYGASDIFDPFLLAQALSAADPLSTAMLAAFPAAARNALQTYLGQAPQTRPAQLPAAVLDGLNALVHGAGLYDAALFAPITLSAATSALVAQRATLDAAGVATLNRRLIDEAFPVALGVSALAVAGASVQLDRVTVLGPLAVHRLQLSDSLVTGFSLVDDTQDGCVRFSAVAVGSRVPRRYESVLVPENSALFTSVSYGDPGYGQLLETADAAIVGEPGSIVAGADSGSEMGAFSAELAAVKERGLLTKYAEYMPLGLTPVIVHVT
jgi:hypothetical protein